MDVPTMDGRDVIAAGAALYNSGDGLSDALGVDFVEWHIGEKVYLCYETTVEEVRFKEVKDSGGCLQRIHRLKAEGLVVVDESLVREHLDNQARRIEDARVRKLEESEGIERLPLEGSDGSAGSNGNGAPSDEWEYPKPEPANA